MKNLTVKIFVGLFVVATVLLQSCKKDSETYSFLLNERGAFVEEPGGTTSLGFTAINISSVTPTTVPQGWSVTVDMNERRISVTAPTTFPDDPKTLADGEEEEEENTNVRFGTVYLTGRSSGGSSVSTSLYVSLDETVDLTGQPSNCYIINKSNARYCIDVTRKGEDTEATMSPASVAILWETPYKVIEFPKLVDGKAYFYHAIGTDDDEKEFFNHGNALLGAFDAAGNLLWSWHLWCAEFDPADEQVELGGEVMMKRNLGAGVVSGTSEEDILASYGVYYQWGRKDPFPGTTAFTIMNEDYTYEVDGEPEVYGIDNRVLPKFGLTAEFHGTIEKSIRNPAVFYAMTYKHTGVEDEYGEEIVENDYKTGDWVDVSDDDYWGGESRKKTIYDPCPVGYKVPVCDADGNTPYAWLVYTAGKWDEANRGFEQEGQWFPTTGTRAYASGGLDYTEANPYSGLWIGTKGKASDNLELYPDLYGQYMFIIDSKRMLKVSKDKRSQGMSLRCVKE